MGAAPSSSSGGGQAPSPARTKARRWIVQCDSCRKEIQPGSDFWKTFSPAQGATSRYKEESDMCTQCCASGPPSPSSTLERLHPTEDPLRLRAVTLRETLFRCMMAYRSRQCIKVVSESGKGRSITYGECLRRAQQLRSGLMSKLLLSPGKRAGVLSPAGPDRLVFQVASLLANVHLVDPGYDASSPSTVAEAGRCEVMLCGANDLLHLVLALCQSTAGGCVRDIVVTGGSDCLGRALSPVAEGELLLEAGYTAEARRVNDDMAVLSVFRTQPAEAPTASGAHAGNAALRHLFIHAMSSLEASGETSFNGDKWKGWPPESPIPSPGPISTTLSRTAPGVLSQREWLDAEVLARLFASQLPRSQPQSTILCCPLRGDESTLLLLESFMTGASVYICSHKAMLNACTLVRPTQLCAPAHCLRLLKERHKKELDVLVHLGRGDAAGIMLQSFEKQNGLDRLREVCVTCDGVTPDEGVWLETMCPLRRIVIAGQFDPSV